jgi:hypothetical protein
MWSDEKETTLKQMWEGGFSASVIGNELGYSRNAIIGKAHRLGLLARRKGFKHKTGYKSRRRSAPRTQRIVLTTTDMPVTVVRNRQPEPTKDELRRLFETAWRNTANGEQNETVRKEIHDPRRKHSIGRGVREGV